MCRPSIAEPHRATGARDPRRDDCHPHAANGIVMSASAQRTRTVTMRAPRTLATIVALAVPAASLAAQPLIAQMSGLTSPGHVIDFGANLYPNLTVITTQFAGITVTHARYYTTGNFLHLSGGFLTNDFSGAPDTLRIVFASPIRNLSFVYHQIGLGQPSVFRAVLAGTVVDSFSYTSNQMQLNNYFGFTNRVFDELQLDFVSDFNFDTLAFDDLGAACRFRNGSGINPPDYSCITTPVLGSTWIGAIASTAGTITTFLAFAPGGPHPGTPLLNGELLVQVSPPVVAVQSPGGFAIPIPNGSSWLGFTVATQGVRLDNQGGVPTFVLLNAIDLVLGL